MRLVRVPTVRTGMLACLLVGACACGADAGVGRTTRSATADRVEAIAAPSPSPDGLADALDVLRGWDARRAAAWREQDRPALRSLYVPGSSALAADLALLRAYAERRLVVRRLESQVFAAQVLHRSPRVLRLRVHDRTSATVRNGTGRETVRVSEPVRRILELRLVGGGWRMASVSGG
jgi:hypothetical protein